MAGSTRGVGGGNAAAAAAALEAQRRAEEARRAAERARKAAEAAAEAQKAAKAERAQAERLADRMDRAPGNSRNALAEKLGPQLKKETDEANKAERDATAALTKANRLEKKALDTANEAISQRRAANTAATQEGKPQPFKGLENVRDAVDAARLDPKDQGKLLGFTSVADPKQAVARDLQSLQRETDRGGREGASELRRLMENSTDPGYKRLLAQQATPQVERISEAVNREDDRMGAGDLKGTLRDLSRAAALAGPGPDGGAAISRAFASKMRDDHLDIDDEDQFAGATRAVIEEGKTPQESAATAKFFGDLHGELKAKDRNPEARKEIEKAINEGMSGRPGFVDKVANKANPVFDGVGSVFNFAGDRVDDLNSVIPDVPGTADIANAVIPGKDIPLPNIKPIPDPSDALDLASAALHGTGDVVANTPEAAKALATAVEYRSAIDKLGPNDKYTLGAGGKAAYSTAELGIKGKVEVTRERDWVPLAQNEGPDGKPYPDDMVRKGPNGTLELKNKKPYVITVDGEASAGFMLNAGAKTEAGTESTDGTKPGADGAKPDTDGAKPGPGGTKAGAGAGAQGKLGALAGGKVELRFESAAEAKRAMDIIAAGGVTGALAAGSGPAGPAAATLAQPVIDKVFGASAKDLPKLTQDLSAVEVKLGAYGELAGKVNAGPLGELDGTLKGDVKGSVRVEMSNGKPTWLVTKLDASGEGSASMVSMGKKAPSRKPDKTLEDGKGAFSTTAGKTRFEGSVEFRRSLGDGFQLKDLAGVNGLGALVTPDSRAKLVLANETELSRHGPGAGIRSELEFHGEPNALISSGALKKALDGDFNGALDSLESVQKEAGLMVAGRVLPYATLGTKGTVQANAGGTGFSLEFEAGRRDYSDPVVNYAGNLTATREVVGRGIEGALNGVGTAGTPLDLRLPMYLRG